MPGVGGKWAEGLDLTRRRFVLSSLACSLASCTMTTSSFRPAEGEDIYSESVQVSLADPSGRNFLSVRLCQYPDANIAWIWAAVFVDGRFWKYQNNAAHWSGTPSVSPEGRHAEYLADTGTTRIQYIREGSRLSPAHGKMVFTSPEEGGISLEVAFDPAGQFAGLIPGRTEVFGRATAMVRLGGQDVSFAGPGQWHEQQQTDPRFTTPFVYASLWGDGVYSTLLQTPEGSGGYLIRNGRVDLFSAAAFGPPAFEREVRLTGRDGPGAELRLEEVKSYYLDIYGKRWRGAFVKSDFLGTRVCGFANTWQM